MVRNSEKQIISHIQNWIYFQVKWQFNDSLNPETNKPLTKLSNSVPLSISVPPINRCSNFWNNLLKRLQAWRHNIETRWPISLVQLGCLGSIAQGFLGSNLNYQKRDDNHLVLFFFSTCDLKRDGILAFNAPCSFHLITKQLPADTQEVIRLHFLHSKLTTKPNRATIKQLSVQ
jgi:hypothetical protein